MQNFIKTLQLCKKVNIVIHVNPDADAIGSAAAIQNELKGYKIYSDILCENDIPDYLKKVFKDVVIKQTPTYPEAEGLLILDMNREDRMGNLEYLYHEYIERGKTQSNVFVLNIDHHEGSKFAKNPDIQTLWYKDASSTCEIIYDLLTKWNETLWDETVKYLVVGLLSDSGWLKYDCTSLKTLETYTDMLRNNNIDVQEIRRCLTKNSSLEEMKNNAEAIASAYKVDKIIFCPISEILAKKDNRLGVKIINNFLNDITADTVVTSALHGNQYNIELSTNHPKFDVSVIARKFNGGGHRCAAGCTIPATQYVEFTEAVKEARNAID